MMCKSIAIGAILASLTAMTAANAQALRFDTAAYVSCRDAQNMTPEARRAVAVFLRGRGFRQGEVAAAANALFE